VPRQSGSGYYDRFRNRLMIPIWDVSGKVIAFGGRALESKEVKYLNFPRDGVVPQGGAPLRVEPGGALDPGSGRSSSWWRGYFDAITLHAHGLRTTRWPRWGTALTTDQARLLGRYAQTVVLLFDPDAPGIGAARRNLEHLINVDLNCGSSCFPAGSDPDAFLRKHGAAAFQAALDSAQDLVEFFLDRRVSGLDLNDAVERARAVDGLLDVVGLIDSPVRREGYVQRVAQRAAISDRTLLEAVAQRRARIGRQDGKARAAPGARCPSTAEEQLVFIGSITRPIASGSPPPAARRDPGPDPAAHLCRVRAAGEAGITGWRRSAHELQPPEVQRRLSSLWPRREMRTCLRQATRPSARSLKIAWGGSPRGARVRSAPSSVRPWRPPIGKGPGASPEVAVGTPVHQGRRQDDIGDTSHGQITDREARRGPTPAEGLRPRWSDDGATVRHGPREAAGQGGRPPPRRVLRQEAGPRPEKNPRPSRPS